MARFLFGVVVVCLAWWGYDRFFVTPVSAGGPGDNAGAGSPAGGAPPHLTAVGSAPADGREGSDPEAAPAAVGAGDFGAVLAATGSRREELIAAKVRAVRAAGSVTEARAALGATGAFLHVPEGRELAGEVMAKIEALPPRDALRESSRLLELASVGELPKDAVEANAAFARLAQRHAGVVDRTVLDPNDTTATRRYEVQPNDNLVNIAKHMRKTVGIEVDAGTIQLLNRIRDPRRIQPGQVLKIPVDPIRTVVHRRSFVVAVYLGDVIIRTYRCAVGKVNEPGQEVTETPLATFEISEKLENPDWHYRGRRVAFGDPENPLGKYFVKFKHPTLTGLGIHGTIEPDSIGTCASLGCVRLGDADIDEYFRLVPVGTPVEVVD